MTYLRFDVVDWATPGLLERVIEKWTSGDYSAAKIARDIPNATRQAIIGKMNRLGIIQGKAIIEGSFADLKLHPKKTKKLTLSPPPKPVIIPKVNTMRSIDAEIKRCACGSTQLQPGRNQCAPCITAAYLKIKVKRNANLK